MRNSVAAGAAHRPAKVVPKAEKKYQQGLALMQQGRWDEAARAFEAAIERSPKDPLFWLNLAQARRKQGKPEAAEAAARTALRLDPESDLARRFLADALSQQGRHAHAVQALSPSLGSDVATPETFVEAGDALVQSHQYAAAVEKYMEAAKRKPSHVPAHIGMGNAFALLGAPQAAYECFRTAVTLAPNDVTAWSSLVHQSMHACRWATLPQDLTRLHALFNGGGQGQISPFAHLALPGSNAAEHRRSAACFASVHLAQAKALTVTEPARRKPGRIRVGYLSSDFHEHATSWLVAEVIELHDRTRFEVFLYSYGVDDGSETRRRMMAAGEHFVEMRELSARAMAERIRADAIDILIDLKGYTFGSRPEVLGYRPAPIQVSFLGYPGTLGTPLVDYIVTDPIVTPPEAAADYDEKFAYLPDCYQPNDRKRPIGPPVTRADCGLPERGFVFCCFNNAYKITPAMFDIWCRLLGKVDGSVLWLLDANLQAKDNLRAEARARGIDPERLVFAPKLPLAQHVARLANADLVLDTLPYNAHTTASDALWAGVPLVTCPGETFASRVAASLLHAVELPELVAGSLEEYASIALRLAQEPSALAALKEKLAGQRNTCALFDSERYARNLEALYERMFERWRSGQPADHLPPEQSGAVRAAVRTDAGRAIGCGDTPHIRGEHGALAATAPSGCPDDHELAQLRTALSLHPYDAAARTRYESAVRLRREPTPPRAIGLIVTCEKYFERALRLHAKLAALNALSLRLVVGRGADVAVHADLVQVDAPDDYESLPRKVRAAFVHAYERYGCAVFKIDDDLEITDCTRFVEDVHALVGGDADYAGFEVGSPDHDRTWHWNKCRDGVLNRT
ncbi:MAG: tetratricopeptide repeat protein, partial [Pseudomonadota bacterium]